MTWVHRMNKWPGNQENVVLNNWFSHLILWGKQKEPLLFVMGGCSLSETPTPFCLPCLSLPMEVSSFTFCSTGPWVLEHQKPGLVCLNKPAPNRGRHVAKIRATMYRSHAPWVAPEPGVIHGTHPHFSLQSGCSYSPHLTDGEIATTHSEGPEPGLETKQSGSRGHSLNHWLLLGSRNIYLMNESRFMALA